MKKIGKMMIGETPEEQLKLEKKRFQARHTRIKQSVRDKKNNLLKRGEGNHKLS